MYPLDSFQKEGHHGLVVGYSEEVFEQNREMYVQRTDMSIPSFENFEIMCVGIVADDI